MSSSCDAEEKTRSSDGDDSGRENVNVAMVTPIVRSGGECVWRESGVLSQAVGFVLERLATITVFSNLIYFIRKSYKPCTLNWIYKE